MKRKPFVSCLLLLLAALFLPLFTFAIPDTVFVTHSATTYLLFTEEVTLVDIGKPSEYLSKIEGKCVFVKATREHTAPTSIFVRHENEYFVAVLAYRPQSNRFLYDYRKKASPEQKDSTGGKQVDMQPVRKHFTAFQTAPQGIRKKHASRDKLKLSLMHLVNDKQATYLGFTLQNGSSIDYEIDLITFERKEKRGKRFSQNNISKAFIEPFVSSGIKVVEAKQTRHLFFAIPLYALGKRSHLEVSFREKNGSRLLTLKLPSHYINQALIYQD
jgi:hypothetical protein